ncbi:MAG: hypothetical protein KGJ30_11705, partial [Burkholderiales bacterium]|nr:hypothetical protein [Burkholderiales bacterium]
MKLITGPANSGKAERVLAETRREAARGGEPWLVVPTVADEREYRRELARDGLVLGARVVRFPALLGEAARRAGLSGPQLEGPLRTRLMGVLAREVGDGATGGLREGRARELERLVAELEALHLTPQAVSASMAEWAGDGDEGAAEAAALVASVYGRYRDLLAAIGWCDAELQAAGALDELRRNPWRWGATPVQFYGFDDLTAVQRDAIETLAVVVGAPVTVALSYEPGRMAFAARGGTYEALRPWATELVALDPASEHYSAAARDSLSHIERGIF